MPKKKDLWRELFPKRKSVSLIYAEKAIEQIAAREGTTVEKVRMHIQLAMLSGLVSKDPAVREKWKRIPCAKELPTPKEVIASFGWCF
jgi:hypothetical protein